MQTLMGVLVIAVGAFAVWFVFNTIITIMMVVIGLFLTRKDRKVKG